MSYSNGYWECILPNGVILRDTCKENLIQSKQDYLDSIKESE